MKNTGTYYPAFAGRSRAGKGKLFYGLTAAQIETAKQIRLDNSSSQSGQIRNLFTFSKIYIERARELAKCGQKDSARNWYRFFTNSQIVLLLEKSDCPGDVKKLSEDLAFLGLECHPLEVPSFETDLESIRDCLTEILSHVKETSRKTKTVGRFATGCAVRR
jgi:hypothetical protein